MLWQPAIPKRYTTMTDPELAQAGGPNGSKLSAALDVARSEVEQALNAL